MTSRSLRSDAPKPAPRAAVAATVLLASLFAPSATAQQPSAGRTILVMVADDLGVDNVGIYQQAGEPSRDVPRTPNLDRLAREGVMFRNAYANPICSPTRAMLLTGRYAHRQGVGEVTGAVSGEPFADEEVTLPELLRKGSGTFTSAAIGKWHLGYEWSHANQRLGRNHMVADGGGFDYFCGNESNLLRGDESHWRYLLRTLRRNDADPEHPHEVVADQVVTSYSLVAQIDATLALLAEDATPRERDLLVYLAFNVPHEPFQKPPDNLHSLDEQLGDAWAALPPSWDLKHHATARLYYRAMVEAMDTEIGRLLREMPAARRANATLIFLGDNGTPVQTTAAPFVAAHAKGTLYEGGIHVPLIVAGRGVEAAPGSVVDALVQSTDVFATVADFAGISEQDMHRICCAADNGPARRLDSHSLRILLDRDPDNDRQWPRWYAFAERFGPNGRDGGPMTTRDALDPPVVEKDLRGYEQPQLGAARIRVEGEAFTIGNRSRVVLSGWHSGQRGLLRATVWIGSIGSDDDVDVVVGTHAESGKTFLVGGGVTRRTDAPGVYGLFDAPLDLHGDAADQVIYELDGELARTLTGAHAYLLFQVLLRDARDRAVITDVSNIVCVKVPHDCDVKAIRDERYKLILTDNGGREQFFDLQCDPWEQNNLVASGAVRLSPEQHHRYRRLKLTMQLQLSSGR